jgi:Transposase IS116/IS110/IS902 family
VDAGRPASLELYDGHPAVDFAGLAAEVVTEVRLLRATCAELATHAAQRETCYQAVDPAGLARSLPGLADVGGPALTACMGDPARFGRGKQFRCYTGLAPKASQTGETDRKGQPMSKAGSSLLRTTLVRAADHARKQDSQLARIYYQQMTERGKGHLGALCVVAASLAERAWTVMRRGTPYVICDTDGRPVTATQAKAIIAGRWTVPPQTRARRRSRKNGEGPPESPRRTVHPGRPPPRHHSTPAATGPSSETLDNRSPIGNQRVPKRPRSLSCATRSPYSNARLERRGCPGLTGRS